VQSVYRINRAALGFDVGYEFAGTSRVYAGLLRGHGSANVSVGGTEFQDQSENIGSLRLGYVRDTLDDANFPGAGSRGELLVQSQVEALGGSNSGEIADLSWDKALSHGPNRILFGTRLHVTWGDPGVFDGLAPLGGFTNLSGYNERELLGEHAALFRTVYYRRLGDSGQLFSVPAFVGGSLEAGNVYLDRDDFISLDNLIFAGSVFVGIDSPFGPIFLAYGRADTGEGSLYLNFGTLLRPRL
jgi:NTE family protein